jgi:uncharacterized membrane protein
MFVEPKKTQWIVSIPLTDATEWSSKITNCLSQQKIDLNSIL